jgi:hypothetical protein
MNKTIDYELINQQATARKEYRRQLERFGEYVFFGAAPAVISRQKRAVNWCRNKWLKCAKALIND